ncbi:MAG: hypothetical protein IPN18_10605 [Ignavibacteriales bacterium]|nr:hypothetical protein [Ignavibacteriales bacterium]
MMLQGMFMVMPGDDFHFTIGFDHARFKVEFMYSLMVSINLPFAPWSINKYKGEISRVSRRDKQYCLRTDKYAERNGRETERSHGEILHASELLKLYDEKLIPL